MGKQSRLKAQRKAGSMSDQEIINSLAQQNEALKARVRELETTLETAGAFTVGGLNKIYELRIRDQQIIEELKTKYAGALYTHRNWLPTRVMAKPMPFDEALDYGKEHDLIPLDFKTSVLIGYTLFIRYGDGEFEVKVYKGEAIFSGSLEDAEKEIVEYLIPLLNRAPFPSTPGRAGLDISDDVLAPIVNRLGPLWNNTQLQSFFWTALKSEFDNLVQSGILTLPEDKSTSDLQNMFSKEVTRRFRNMRKNEQRGTEQRPTRKHKGT